MDHGPALPQAHGVVQYLLVADAEAGLDPIRTLGEGVTLEQVAREAALLHQLGEGGVELIQVGENPGDGDAAIVDGGGIGDPGEL